MACYLSQAFAQPTCYRPWPGFRHPCRNDGFSGSARSQAPAWERDNMSIAWIHLGTSAIIFYVAPLREKFFFFSIN